MPPPTDPETVTAADPPPTGPGGPGTHSPTAYPGGAGVGSVVAGRYKLTEPLGVGGMGAVFLACQSEPVRRFVALKVIRAGFDSKMVLARFETERQAFALMDHPNIAKVLDAGTTDEGRPFFVMELVAGVPITAYCDAHRLTPRERLELFLPVCRAVQHAHQKGVIHRDIKPSNVLVAAVDDRPVPKLIDFGVAKAAGQPLTDITLETGIGAVVGTPEYMSPEQASLDRVDVDTRSDVYALGVLLYELLTGSTPVDRKSLGQAAILEVLRIVREVEAPRPSVKLSAADGLPGIAAARNTDPAGLCRLLRGELDWVALKALEKDRTRRYATANALARDVERYLADEVVEARPPSAGYRLKKLARRYKGRVVAAGLVLLALVAGLAGTTWGLVRAAAAVARATRAEGDAVEQARLAGGERDKSLAAAAAERSAKAAEVAQRREAEAANQRARRALGSFTDDLMEKQLGSKATLTANEQAILWNALAQWEVFAQLKGESVEGRASRAEGAFRVGRVQQKLGLNAEAEANYRRAVALQERLAADLPAVPDHRADLAASQNSLGFLMRGTGNLAGAGRAYRAALALRTKLIVDFPAMPEYTAGLATSHIGLGNVLDDGGDRAGAEWEYRAALILQGKLAADFPAVPDYRSGLGDIRNNLGNLLWQTGDRAGAAEEYRAAQALRVKLAADAPAVPWYRVWLANTHHNLGKLLAEGGDRAGAEKELRAALALHTDSQVAGLARGACVLYIGV